MTAGPADVGMRHEWPFDANRRDINVMSRNSETASLFQILNNEGALCAFMLISGWFDVSFGESAKVAQELLPNQVFKP